MHSATHNENEIFTKACSYTMLTSQNYQTLSRRMTNCTLMPSWFYKLCYFSAVRVLRPIVHHKGLNRGDWGWIGIRLGLRRPRHTQGLRNSWPAVGKRATLEASDYKPQNIRLPAELHISDSVETLVFHFRLFPLFIKLHIKIEPVTELSRVARFVKHAQ